VIRAAVFAGLVWAVTYATDMYDRWINRTTERKQQ